MIKITQLNSRWLFLVILVCFALFNIIFRTLLFPDLFQGDTGSYDNAMRLLIGETDDQSYVYRLLKPLPLYSSVYIAKLFSLPRLEAFFAQSVFFYLASAFILYFFLFHFFRDRWLALSGSLIYISAYPILRCGLSLTTDMGGWFFNLVAIFFIWFFYQNSQKKYFYASIATIAVGFLWKEYVIIAGLLLFLVILFHKNFKISEKVSFIIQSALIFILCVGPWQFYIQAKYGYSYIDWYSNPLVYHWLILLFFSLKSLFAVFLLGWFLVICGIPELKKLDREKRNFILLLTVASCLMLAWGAIDSRLFFVLAVPLAFFMVLGVKKLRESGRRRLIILFLLLVVAGNYFWLGVSPFFRPWLGQYGKTIENPFPLFTHLKARYIR